MMLSGSLCDSLDRFSDKFSHRCPVADFLLLDLKCYLTEFNFRTFCAME